jgi:TonB family protein
LIDQIRQKSPKPLAISVPEPKRVKETQATPDAAFYKKRADDYIAKGEYKRAIADYDEAIRLNPQNAAAYYNRGFAYHYINNQVRAFENYKTAILIKSELAIQPATQCVLYDLTKNITTRKAIEECTKTINLDTGFALAFYIRGNAYLTQEEPELAIADYNKFIEFDPKNVLAYINRGDAYWDKEDYDRAAADYNKAIELDSSNEIAKKNLQRLQSELLSTSTNKRKLSASLERINPPQVISHGELNSRATKLVTPTYPPEAKRMHIQGKVKVQITIDESGNVISAKANSGKGLLRFSAESAARRSRFEPISVNDQTVKANGFIVYNFILP